MLGGHPIGLDQPHRFRDEPAPLDGDHLRYAGHLLDDPDERVELRDQVLVEQGGDPFPVVVVGLGKGPMGGGERDKEDGGGEKKLEEAGVPADPGGEGPGGGGGGAVAEGGEDEGVAAGGGVAEEGGRELVAEDEGAAGEEVVESEKALEGDGGIAGGAEAGGEGAGGGGSREAGPVAEGEERLDVAGVGGLVGRVVGGGA